MLSGRYARKNSAAAEVGLHGSVHEMTNADELLRLLKKYRKDKVGFFTLKDQEAP